MVEECIYFNVTKFSRAINLLWEEEYRLLNLSPSQAYLLQFILDKPGETPKVLAEKMGLKLSTITRLVDGLSTKGLVERKKENKDKRECNIYPTKSGKNLERALNKTSKVMHKKIRKLLGEKDVESIVELIIGFNNKIETEREGGK